MGDRTFGERRPAKLSFVERPSLDLQTTRAMIHNDVVQDHAPADPVKGTAIPKNEVPLTPAAKQQLRTKKLAVEKAKLVNREHATTGKYSCLSPRDIQSAKCFDELFHTANKALHIVNLVLELIDPEFALSCHELSKSLKNDVDKYGHHLSRSECHLPGVVFHWNVDAKAVDQWHTDRNSAFGGEFFCILFDSKLGNIYH